ncbi:hypothetical protein EDB19DRAFT_977993 [Suillus lakei]|nr:hypothetical protein EDB19DRAFT_977993 [Suillus lakei]
MLTKANPSWLSCGQLRWQYISKAHQPEQLRLFPLSLFFSLTNSSRFIMPINTSSRALLTSFFMLLTLLSCAFSAPLSAVTRDVWVPSIICPTSDSIWTVGGTFSVTWDTSKKPSQVTNPTGKIYLRQGDKTQSSPIASGFALSDGKVEVTIPGDTTPGDYMIVLFGDSGNWSAEFPN